MKEKNWNLDLYYLGAKLISILFFILVLLFKHGYGLKEDYAYAVMFFFSIYLVINIHYVLSQPGSIYAKKSFLRGLDYFVALYIAILALNLYGLIPLGFLLGLYAVYYYREVLLVLLAIIAILLTKVLFWNLFTGVEMFLGILYLFGTIFISSKINLLWVIRLKNYKLNNCKRNLQKINDYVGNLESRVSIFEEVINVLENLYKEKRIETLSAALKGLLKAEEILIFQADKFFSKSLNRENYVIIGIGNTIFAIKPIEKYLIKDKRYREKLKILVTVLKPYLESLLANSK